MLTYFQFVAQPWIRQLNFMSPFVFYYRRNKHLNFEPHFTGRTTIDLNGEMLALLPT